MNIRQPALEYADRHIFGSFGCGCVRDLVHCHGSVCFILCVCRIVNALCRIYLTVYDTL